MRYNDILNENQINELGIIKNIKGAIQGARAGYQASKLQKKGVQHSARIVNNIRTEFQQMVGGGMEPTYDNLINFLQELGLSDLESIQNPSAVSEASVGTLSAKQIDDIIRAAVRKNYSRIVAAQKGRSVNAPAKTQPTMNTEPETSPPASSPETSPRLTPEPETGMNLAPKPQAPEIKVPPVAGNIAAITKAYSILDPSEREELKKQLDIIDDQDRLASGTNESKIKVMSKFLGREL